MKMFTRCNTEMLDFLDCNKDTAEWEKLVTQFGVTDPHFSPALYKAFGGGLLAVYGDIAIPFRDQGEGWVGNAYNFGGPIGNYNRVGEISVVFNEWKNKNGFKERCTLNPYVCPNVYPLGCESYSKESVFVDLTSEKPSIRQTTRHAIEKAEDAGVVTNRVHPTTANVKKFDQLYHESMAQKGAARHWFYKEGFFHKVLEYFGPYRSALFFTTLNGVLDGACLVILDANVCYYHWAFNLRKFKEVPTGHFQVWAVMNWARIRSKKLHLGGGLAEDDSLFKFKAGFSDSRVICRSYVTTVQRKVA